jgi:hypothetical protein
VIEDGQAQVDALLAAIQTRLHTLPTQAWAQEEEAEEGGDEAAGERMEEQGAVGMWSRRLGSQHWLFSAPPR